MPASEAQISANRRNSLRSTGPRTPEGKAASRANALKHGMTGEGIALPIEDAFEVGRRFAALQEELAPRTEMGRILVGRVATLSVRMERCVLQESAALSEKVGHAGAEFDDKRLADVEHLLAWIGSEPATFARRLRTTPEGIDRMARVLGDLKEALFDPYIDRWDWVHCERTHSIMGVRRLDVPFSRLKSLTDALADGDFKGLRRDEVAGADPEAIRARARREIAEIIDAELGRLAALRETLDVEAIERNRADAARRALFDPSREAILARRYEASAERGMYRALRELKEVEAAGPGPSPEVGPDAEELASIGDDVPEPREAVGSPRPARPAPARDPENAPQSSAPPRDTVFAAESPGIRPVGTIPAPGTGSIEGPR